MSELKKKTVEIRSLLIMIEKVFSRPKSRTEKTFFKGSCKFDFMKKLSVISNISCKKQSNLLLQLWLGARSIPPTFENKLRCYKQRFGKIAGGEQKYDKGLNDIAVVVAAEWRHYLFYVQQYFSALGTVFPKSFKEAFSNNSSLDVREI